ncbi:hypothetical protein H0A36_09420 [Endozoicomonas sp. SM1973]|uniref:Uncharacterized protein n=1 Tax=Spartinivicinus marinus TaxID=2994442 RepID=A0A853HWV8_9GAMM|nr:hypothetical protein [Spartinivicinus marinus]MCX4028094.1 hypothetical protein [Spartinivicinus marinus]NYZ66230.1 hypothetical protein [Spartinivicinus marinus]
MKRLQADYLDPNKIGVVEYQPIDAQVVETAGFHKIRRTMQSFRRRLAKSQEVLLRSH